MFNNIQDLNSVLPEEPCSICPQGQSGCYSCPERRDYEKALKEVKEDE